jgi:hypothetical protein
VRYRGSLQIKNFETLLAGVFLWCGESGAGLSLQSKAVVIHFCLSLTPLGSVGVLTAFFSALLERGGD